MSADDWMAVLRLPPLPGIDAAADDCTWPYTWPSGRRLADDLPRLAEVRDRRVLDIGCGRGHCGLRALLLGARAAVLADGDARAVAWLDQVLADNGLTAGRAVLHRWGDVVPDAPYELVLGGDILYRPALFPALIASIASALAPDGVALLSDPRQRLEPELSGLAALHGLRWDSRREGAYTLVTLRR